MMLKKQKFLLITSFTLLFIWNTAVQAQDIKISSAGCKTEFFLMKELASAYKAKTGISIKTGATGNKKAIYLMLDNKIDFAFTCKTIDKLAKKFKLQQSKIAGWKSIPIAKDPIILVSNKNNGIKNLTISQITDIFQGKVTNWKEVGGNDLSILISYLNPKLESGTPIVFKEVTGGKKMKFGKAKTLDSPAHLGNFVASKSGAITFMGQNSYKKTYGDVLTVDGVEPNKESIQNKQYPLTVTYNLTIQGNNKDVNDFVNYSLSDEGKQVISNNFFPYSE